MPRPVLQLWRFDESEYDRPNQPWVCGKQANGQACRIGPDAHGACLATYECLPRKDGAHHRCTRPESAGGKCAEGPGKDGVCAHAIATCEPVRSWKSKRRIASLALAVAALVIGLGAFFARGPVSNAFIAPGPLTSAHAATGAECADCHGAAVRGWIAAATDPKADAARCIACHAGAAGTHALSPHGLDTTEKDSRRLDCASCHPEHRGDRVELVRGGDASCRACHPEAAGSFASSHPEFEKPLGAGVARLTFDHTSKGHVAERCESCHVLDGDGRRRVLPGFDAACSRCHLDDIAKADAVAWKDPASVRRGDDPSWENDLRALTCRVPLAPGVTLAALPKDADPSTLPPPVPAAAITSRTWLASGSMKVMPASFATGLPATGEWLADGADLSYRPLVHGDPVLKSWLDLVARHSGRKPRYKDDGGRCTVCHALSPQEDGAAPEMAWTGHHDDSRLTRFSHRAHGEVACEQCHRPQDKMFAPIAKATCAACHASGKAPDGCLTCHGYHEARPEVTAPVAERVIGAAACENCHANAAKAWAASAHGREGLDSEERRESAAKIATALGVGVRSERCNRCHATGRTTTVTDGGLTWRAPEPRVTCEACHGAARAWIGVHADLAIADRAQRSIDAGMNRADDAYALAEACLSCHVVADPALVAAGHLSGSPMDAALWSQGEVRHGFADGCTGAETAVNREMPAARRRTLFVVGALLDLSHSLDALALSKEPGDYETAMRTRISKARKKLDKAAAALPSGDALAAAQVPELDESPADRAKFAESLRDLATRARELARRLSASHAADSADALDGVIGAKIKGAPWAPPS